MTRPTHRFTTCLWFDGQGEEAARFYTGIFKNGRIGPVALCSKEAAQASGRPEGSVLTVAFELDGQSFLALNGGPVFKFNEAISIVVNCETQDEVDHYWNHLSMGGEPKAQMCGWLKDRFGVSWQIVPTLLPELMSEPDPEKGRKAMAAVLKMKKIDVEALRRAAA